MRTTKDNFWLDAPYEPGRPLAGEHETDVAIIGGGFTGMASAYFIKRRFPGKRVIVLESEFIGFGSSGRNSGIATHLLGHNILPVLKSKGVERTAALHRLSAAALSLRDQMIEEHAIDCDRKHAGMLVVVTRQSNLDHSGS